MTVKISKRTIVFVGFLSVATISLVALSQPPTTLDPESRPATSPVPMHRPSTAAATKATTRTTATRVSTTTRAMSRPSSHPTSIPTGGGLDKVDPAILKLFPKDTVAFVVVNKIDGFFNNYSSFIYSMFPPMMAQSIGDPVALSGGVLTDLEPYLDGDKSVALLLLDVKTYAPDLLAKDSNAGKMNGMGCVEVAVTVDQEQKPDSADDKENKSEIPMAIIAPMAKLKDYLEGKEIAVEERNGWSHTKDFAFTVKGDYAIIVSNKKCMRAFGASEMMEITPRMQAHINANDVSAWVNYPKMLELKGTKFLSQMTPQVSGFGFITYFYSQMPPMFAIHYVFLTRGIVFNKADDVMVGLKLSPEGLLASGRWGYKSDSVMGKALAACKAPPKSLMDCLPEASGVFNYGAAKDCLRTPPELKSEYLKATLKELTPDLPEDTAKTLLDVVMAYQEQVDGVQHYIGSAGEGQLPAGMGTIVRCKSPEKFMEQTKKTVEAINAFSKYVAENKETLQGKNFDSPSGLFASAVYSIASNLTLQYTKDGESLSDNMKADSVELEFEAFKEMPPEVAGSMLAGLGEEKFRILIAKVDKDKVAITFAGGTPFIEAMIKSAKQPKAKVEADPVAAASLDKLPAKNRVAVLTVDTKAFYNIFIETMMQVMHNNLPPGFTPIDTPTPPISAAVNVDGNDLVITGFIPCASIRVIADKVMAAYMR